MFHGGHGGCGCGNCVGWNSCGGWGLGGPCNKCGHCCYCNRSHNMTMLGLAAMHYICCCRRPYLDVPHFKHGGGDNRFGGFPSFGGCAHGEAKERVCEDVRTGRGAYRYF